MDATRVLWFVLSGIVTGIFSGLIGVGGGVVIVPALVFLWFLRAQGSRHYLIASRTTGRLACSMGLL